MTERDLTKMVNQYFQLALRPDAAWTHFPAGELRTARTGALLKAMGTKPGWPDFQIIFDAQAFFIELKTGKGRVSENQKIAHEKLREAGAEVEVCRNFDDVVNTVNDWGLTQGFI